MKIHEITDFLNGFAPFALQESYDNSGLLIGDPGEEVTGILICLDVTPEIFDEARNAKCNLIISHHPLIFQPLKKLTGSSLTEQMVITAIREKIGVLAVHTNLDSVIGGINSTLADKIELVGQQILSPRKGMLRKLVTFCPAAAADKVRSAIFEAGAGHIGNYDSCSFNADGQGSFRANDNAKPFVGEINKLHFEPETRIETIYPVYLEAAVIRALLSSHPYEEVAYDIYPLENEWRATGIGVIGDLEREMTSKDFLEMTRTKLDIRHLRYCSGKPDKEIMKVAVCGGSGAFLINDAISRGADAFLTADLKYHDFQAAAGQILLVDAGHYETEHFAKELLKAALIEKLPTFAVQISKLDTNPVHYL